MSTPDPTNVSLYRQTGDVPVLLRQLEQKSEQLERANRDLAEREARLKLILDSEPECVKLLGPDGSLRDMNRAGLDMLEADSFEQVAGQCVYPLLVEEHRAAFRALTERVFRGESGMLQFEIVGLKGTRRWLETNSVPLRDAAGRVSALLGITRDITESKRSEAMVACQSKVLEGIAWGVPLGESLTTLVRDLEAVAPGMRCSVLLIDADGMRVRHGAAPSLPDAFNRAVDGELIGPRAGSCGTAAFRREAVVVEDIATDPLWTDYRDLALSHGLRACWSTPIFDERQGLLGTFAIYYGEPGLPTELHKTCIGLATSLAAVAIGSARAAAALHKSEGRYRRLVGSNIIGVMIANTDGRITEANEAFLRMVRYTREDLAAGCLRWDAMTPPEWRAVDEHILREVQATGACPPVEKECLRKDGSRVPIRASVALLDDGSGDTVCLIADLTEQKRAEAEQREAEQRIRSVFEQASDGIYVISSENRYLEANARGLELLGYTRDELLGMSVADVLAPHEVARLAVEPTRMMSGVPHLAEWEYVRRDRATFLGEVSARRLDDRSYLAIVRDVTTRRQADAAVRESEAKLRKVIDGLGPLLFVGLMTLDGVVIEANRPALAAAGLRPEDVLGKPVEHTYWWAWSEPVQQQLRAAVGLAAAGTPSRYDVQIRVAEGALIWLDFSIHPLRDASGKVAFLIPSGNVITERKQAEQELESSRHQLEVLSRRLLGAQENERRRIAHELHDEIGQLLTAVKLDLETVLRQPGTAAVATGLGEGMASIDRVVTRVRDLSLDLRPSMLDDLGLLATLRWYVQNQAKRPGAFGHLALTLPPVLPRLPDEIETACFRVAQEALTNIARHAGARHVAVLLEVTEAYIELTVHDDGAGFDTVAVRQAALAGAGFGLLSMRERAEFAGGDLSVVSAPGQGTTVRARFPVSKAIS